MLSYLTKRFLLGIPVLFFVTIIVFAVMNIVPGDAARTILGTDASPQAVAALQERLGLNRPLYVQYFSWVGGILQGDLGNSLIDNSSVSRALMQALPITLQLSLLALAFAAAFGIIAGVLAAKRVDGLMDTVFTFVALSAISIPGFWLAILLIYAFSTNLTWLPSSGFVRLSDGIGQSLVYSILPAISLSLRPAGVFMRLVRSSMIEVMHSDYIRTARAKGVAPTPVMLRHGLRSALLPLVTILGIDFASLLGNVIVIDTVFAIPGFGRLLYGAFLRFDIVMMQSLVFVFALLVFIINFLTDVSYSIIDPRIRYS